MGLTGIFIISQFFIDLFRANLIFAFSNLSSTIFATELTINKNVHMAIEQPELFGTVEVFQILISLYIIYSLLKFLTLVQLRLPGAQSKWGAFLFSIPIFMIIEISAIAVIDGGFGFFPFRDGIWFLIKNFHYLISNFTLFA